MTKHAFSCVLAAAAGALAAPADLVSIRALPGEGDAVLATLPPHSAAGLRIL